MYRVNINIFFKSMAGKRKLCHYIIKCSRIPLIINTEILITWHLKRVIQRVEVLLVTGKKVCQPKRKNSETCSKMSLKVYVHHCCGFSWPQVSYSSNFLTMETTKITEEDPDDPWTNKWKRYPNGILHQLVVQSKHMNSNKISTTKI
jgi:hypothetical protein